MLAANLVGSDVIKRRRLIGPYEKTHRAVIQIVSRMGSFGMLHNFVSVHVKTERLVRRTEI